MKKFVRLAVDRSQRRGRHAFLAVFGLVFAALPVPAAAQPAFGDGQPLRGIGTPISLAITPTQFRFAAELANLGSPFRATPSRTLIEGAGSVAPAPSKVYWQLDIWRLTVDGIVVQAGQPLAIALVVIDTSGPTVRPYRASYAGLNSIPQGAANPALQRLLARMVDTSIYALFVPYAAPIVARAPVVDFNLALHRFATGLVPNAQLVQAAAPAVALGLIDYRDREAMVVEQTGTAVVRAFNQDTALSTNASGVIHLATAVPLLVNARATGNMPMLMGGGTIDFLLRLAIALEGMPDPMDALQPLTPAGISLPPGAFAIPPPVAAAPTPTVVPAAAPKPAARPAVPAQPKPAPAAATSAPPQGKSGTITFEEMQKQLGQLQELLKQGKITKEQYESQQRHLLERL